MNSKSVAVAHLGIALWSVCAASHAQPSFPNKPVRVIVPYAPGGQADRAARILFTKLSEKLGQQFTIDNRVGANGIVGSEMAAKASPDGYTLLFEGNRLACLPGLYTKLPFAIESD